MKPLTLSQITDMRRELLLNPELLADLQKAVDEMKQVPSLGQYVEQRSLKLIDSKYTVIDQLLNLEILK